jgi:hypothetical protein
MGFDSILDWSKTAIGPVSGWSQALRTKVGMLLRSGFSLGLVVEIEVYPVYSDSYRPSAGAKHSKSMNQPAPSSASLKLAHHRNHG